MKEKIKKRRNSIIIISVLVISLIVILYLIEPYPLSPYDGLPEPMYDELNSPSTPILYSIEPDSYLNGSVELSWSESIIPTGANYLIGYSVYRKKDSGSWNLNQILVERSHVDLISVVAGEYHEYSYTVLASYIILTVFPHVLYTSQYSNIQNIYVGELNPLTDPSIIINYGVSTTDTYEVMLGLYCDNAEEMSFKLSSDTGWTTYESYNTTKHITLPELSVDNPNYTVGVKYQKDTWVTEPVYDDITYSGVLPSHPLISINSGAETTNSLTVSLTLSCNDATKMQFEIHGMLINFTPYTESLPITFSINGPDYPNYKVGVIFGNNIGNLEMIYDEITYVPIGDDGDGNGGGDGDGDGDENGDGEEPLETDYTMIYVLIAVFGGTIGIAVFLTLRKKKDKRIRYTTKKGKSRVIKPLKLKSK